ncbi:uncharacterized protein MONOS_5569 [Monocercomonoides exilis]|uniref:uncharacterized protein n=1 Tax=Monocercomonoides exilis TaxID=2049356 RepID=UPI003559DCA8|nr:hypothetical protein MONOS_5569 [Monocercomonoides exilis]|eukprot:MONOS_5569.1-p1 / transcript=MONOS_5569.1 / gene=MONOS_5569 / organism=Monocercomonoides_exilis_PA203 / gene_product=unspecified product / transcript_product=unspecified product / location=Mono_scaffold00163:92888-95507(+) / protein_length=846 / sequence_SO=supercontig / SO=protein_coding / is_pseudo=false
MSNFLAERPLETSFLPTTTTSNAHEFLFSNENFSKPSCSLLAFSSKIQQVHPSLIHSNSELFAFGTSSSSSSESYLPSHESTNYCSLHHLKKESKFLSQHYPLSFCESNPCVLQTFTSTFSDPLTGLLNASTSSSEATIFSTSFPQKDQCGTTDGKYISLKSSKVNYSTKNDEMAIHLRNKAKLGHCDLTKPQLHLGEINENKELLNSTQFPELPPLTPSSELSLSENASPVEDLTTAIDAWHPLGWTSSMFAADLQGAKEQITGTEDLNALIHEIMFHWNSQDSRCERHYRTSLERLLDTLRQKEGEERTAVVQQITSLEAQHKRKRRRLSYKQVNEAREVKKIIGMWITKGHFADKKEKAIWSKAEQADAKENVEYGDLDGDDFGEGKMETEKKERGNETTECESDSEKKKEVKNLDELQKLTIEELRTMLIEGKDDQSCDEDKEAMLQHLRQKEIEEQKRTETANFPSPLEMITSIANLKRAIFDVMPTTDAKKSDQKILAKKEHENGEAIAKEKSKYSSLGTSSSVALLRDTRSSLAKKNQSKFIASANDDESTYSSVSSSMDDAEDEKASNDNFDLSPKMSYLDQQSPFQSFTQNVPLCLSNHHPIVVPSIPTSLLLNTPTQQRTSQCMLNFSNRTGQSASPKNNHSLLEIMKISDNSNRSSISHDSFTSFQLQFQDPFSLSSAAQSQYLQNTVKPTRALNIVPYSRNEPKSETSEGIQCSTGNVQLSSQKPFYFSNSSSSSSKSVCLSETIPISSLVNHRYSTKVYIRQLSPLVLFGSAALLHKVCILRRARKKVRLERGRRIFQKIQFNPPRKDQIYLWTFTRFSDRDRRREEKKRKK